MLYLVLKHSSLEKAEAFLRFGPDVRQLQGSQVPYPGFEKQQASLGRGHSLVELPASWAGCSRDIAFLSWATPSPS